MGRRRVARQEKTGAADWLVTYGDLVTLLLTFFVLLFSFSTIDAQKWQALVSSFTGGAGILDGDTSLYEFPELTPKEINELEISAGNMDDEELDYFIKLFRDIEGYLDEKEIAAEVKMSREFTEILLRFKESVLFDTGQAEIKIEAIDILNTIADVFSSYDDAIERIRVDGHADSRPINTHVYPTNWDLSAKRAVNVVRYFSEEKYLKPSKLSASAYGEFHPIDSNSTKEGMAKNRRVEIFIIRAIKPVDSIELTK